jgi:hypothetical protein
MVREKVSRPWDNQNLIPCSLFSISWIVFRRKIQIRNGKNSCGLQCFCYCSDGHFFGLCGLLYRYLCQISVTRNLSASKESASIDVNGNEAKFKFFRIFSKSWIILRYNHRINGCENNTKKLVSRTESFHAMGQFFIYITGDKIYTSKKINPN